MNFVTLGRYHNQKYLLLKDYNMATTEILKTKKIIAWVIAGILTALYAFSSAGKLFLHPEQMAQMHLENWRVIIALGEIISALLFLFPGQTFTEHYCSVLIWVEQLFFI